MAKVSFKDLLNEENKFDDGIRGKKIMLYGSNSTGKTYQTCHLPKPFLMMTEAGGSAINAPKTPIEKWSEFKLWVDDLCKNVDEYKNDLQTIIIDTAENLVELSEIAVCNQFGVRDLSEITGKQNGYNIARKDFKTQINRLTYNSYTVVFIAHEEHVEETDPLTGETYEFVQPKGTSNEKSSMRMLRDLCDYIIYLRPNGIDPQTFETIPSTAICKRTKHVFARSRFDIQTFIDPFTADGLVKAIEESVRKSAEKEGAGIGFTNPRNEYTKEDYFEIIKPYIVKLHTICPDEVSMIIETELGEGKKVTDATDDDIVALDNIYNNLVTKATMLKITV